MRCKAHVRRGGVAGRRSSGRGQCGHNGSAAPRWGAHALTVRVGRAASSLAVGGERKTKTREKKKNTTLRWHLHSHPQPCARGGPTAVHTGREKVAWPAARASLACAMSARAGAARTRPCPWRCSIWERRITGPARAQRGVNVGAPALPQTESQTVVERERRILICDNTAKTLASATVGLSLQFPAPLIRSPSIGGSTNSGRVQYERE